MLFSLMEKLRRIFNRMTLRGDTLLPPCPPSQSIQASPVGGTIKIAPEHLRHRDLLAQASSSGGCAPVPHFTSMGGALMALQQFVAKMSVDPSQTESAGRALTLPTTTIISNRTPSPPASHIPIITPMAESEVPPEESEPERPMVEPVLSFAAVLPPPVIVEPVGPTLRPASRVHTPLTAMPVTAVYELVMGRSLR
jgi:hypothetical protein